MKSANEVAKYILTLSNPDEGDIISHLKLQKLLYYCQGANLALRGKPLFSEEILAWDHGPVVREVYDEYKEYGSDALPIPHDLSLDSFDDDEKEIIDDVYSLYGQFSAWKLRNMTHDEPPWRDTPRNGVIPKEMMQDYFETLIEDDEET